MDNDNEKEFIVEIADSTDGISFLISDYDSYDWANFTHSSSAVSYQLAEVYKQHLEWQLELVNRYLVI